MGMTVVGLTGPSGAGKSAVARCLAKHGYDVLDADRAARGVVEPGEPCLAALAAAFGPEILTQTGALDRKRLAAIAFSDAEKLGRLNEITHPFIMARMENELDKLYTSGCRRAVLDAPALYEAGADRLCGCVAAVVSDETFRLKRVMARDGLTETEARRRIAAQPPRSFYTDRADYVIVNDGDFTSLGKAAEELARWLSRRTEARKAGPLTGNGCPPDERKRS